MSFFKKLLPQGTAGFAPAMAEVYPLLMSMGASMQAGQSPFAGAPQGMAAMMAMDEAEEGKRRWEADMDLRRAANARAEAASRRAAQGNSRAASNRALAEQRQQAAQALTMGILTGDFLGQSAPSDATSPLVIGSPAAQRANVAARDAVMSAEGGPTAAAAAALDSIQGNQGDDLLVWGAPAVAPMSPLAQSIAGFNPTMSGQKADVFGANPMPQPAPVQQNDQLREIAQRARTQAIQPEPQPQGLSPERRQMLAQAIMNPHVPSAVKQRAMEMLMPQQAQPQWERFEAADGSVWVYDENNPQTRQQLSGPSADPADMSAKEAQISRLMSTGIDRNTAIGIADGVLVVSRDPITGEATLVNKAGLGAPQISRDPSAQASTQATQPVAPDPNDPLAPPQFDNAEDAFGAEGFVKGAANTLSDAIGVGALYPEVQQTQRDFDVLSEKLVQDVAGAYDRQPPSWLLRNIEQLTPRAGNPLRGADDARTRLISLGRDLGGELTSARASLQDRTLSPKGREALEAREASLSGAVSRIRNALRSLGVGDPDATEPAVTKSGIQWKIVE